MAWHRVLWAVGLAMCWWLARMGHAQTRQGFTISLDQEYLDAAVKVPASFIGLSIEPGLKPNTPDADAPPGIELYAKDPVFRRLIQHLTAYETGPLIIRWGGHSQDESSSPYKPQVWDALVDLHAALDKKVQFTLPINLKSGDLKAAKTQLGRALDKLSGEHKEAVYAINLGNEPAEYGSHSDKDSQALDHEYMSKQYWDDVLSYVQALRGTVTAWSGGSAQFFSGPGTSRATASIALAFEPGNMTTLAELGKDKPGWPFFKAATLHLVGLPDDVMALEDAQTSMLDNSLLEAMRGLVEPYMLFAPDTRLQLRIESLSSAPRGGIPGASDAMAGALFVIKAALTLLQANVSGVNFHSAGCAPAGPILFPATCVDPYYADSTSSGEDNKYRVTCPASCGDAEAPAEANAPYYGMWFMQKLLRRHQELKVLPAEAILPDSRNPNDRVSVYALTTPRSLRVAVVSSSPSLAADAADVVTITIQGNDDSTEVWGYATVTYLMGADHGLETTAEHMALAALRIDESGNIQGSRYTCKVQRRVDPDRQTTTYRFRLPMGSAAILVIPNTRKLKGPDTDKWLKYGLPDDVNVCAE